jgi:Ni/Fe-hydrogenase 1 B-type cytochrome subunit
VTRPVDGWDPSEVARQPREYFRRQYVWQWPVRITHWVQALCVLVLFGTGMFMAWPVLTTTGAASGFRLMHWVRQVHLAFAAIFVANFLWRIVWFWLGNRYARSGFPFVWQRDWWLDLFWQAGDYLRLQRGRVHLGHNALGGLAYTLGPILLGWLQIFSGAAMYSEAHPEGVLAMLTGWVLTLFGGSFQVHMFHHLVAWLIIVWSILHVYIVFYDGQQHKNGLITSMITGEKFYRPGDFDHDTWLS